MISEATTTATVKTRFVAMSSSFCGVDLRLHIHKRRIGPGTRKEGTPSDRKARRRASVERNAVDVALLGAQTAFVLRSIRMSLNSVGHLWPRTRSAGNACSDTR